MRGTEGTGGVDGGCPKSGEAGVEGEDQKESAGREWGRGAEKKIINKIKWDWDGQKEPRGSGSLVTRRSRKKARRESELWDTEPDGSARCGVWVWCWDGDLTQSGAVRNFFRGEETGAELGRSQKWRHGKPRKWP